MKTCRACGKDKPEEEYWLKSDRRYPHVRRYSTCKTCCAQRRKELRKGAPRRRAPKGPPRAAHSFTVAEVEWLDSVLMKMLWTPGMEGLARNPIHARIKRKVDAMRASAARNAEVIPLRKVGS